MILSRCCQVGTWCSLLYARAWLYFSIDTAKRKVLYTIKNIFQGHITIHTKSIGNSSNTVWSECAFCINVCDLGRLVGLSH